jgi:PST family polysaccharide transporter
LINKIKNIANTEDKKRLLSNFVSLSVLQGANYILPLITLPYLVRVLGVEYFGLLAFATATVMYFQILTDYGFNLTATREISIHRDNKEKVIEIFSSVMIIKFLLMFVSFFLLSILVFSFEKFSKDALVYFLTFGTVVGQVLFPVWFFQGMERMKYITYLNILSKVIFTIAIFVFVKEQSDFYLVPLLTSIGFLVAGIWSLYLVKKEFGVGFEVQTIDTIKHHLVEGWDIFVSMVFSSMYRSSNIIILGLLTNNTIVGYYSIAEKVVKTLQSLQDVVGNTLFPYLSKKFSITNKSFFDLNKRFFKFIFLIYFSLSLITMFSSEYIIYILMGEFNEIAILNLQIMSFVILVGGFNYYYGILGLVSMNCKKDFSKYIIITGLFNLLFCIVSVYLYPNYGASISMIISESVLLSLIVLKILKIKKEFV